MKTSSYVVQMQLNQQIHNKIHHKLLPSYQKIPPHLSRQIVRLINAKMQHYTRCLYDMMDQEIYLESLP